MILSIGEILADLFGQRDGNVMKITAAIGGAPFNAAAYAKKAGASVTFIGRVGDDVIGKFLLNEAEKIGFDEVILQSDSKRNTTLAFVALENGERSFSFFRNDTADIYVDEIDLAKFPSLKILHLGTLMLSEQYGRDFIVNMMRRAKERNILVAADVNFRASLFGSDEKMLKAFSDVLSSSDILKLSDDEACLVTGTDSLESALSSLAKSFKGGILAITAGKSGSYAIRCGNIIDVKAKEQLRPIDTTGAGDAFFGTLLAGLDAAGELNRISDEKLVQIFEAANRAGALATQHLGAISY